MEEIWHHLQCPIVVSFDDVVNQFVSLTSKQLWNNGRSKIRNSFIFAPFFRVEIMPVFNQPFFVQLGPCNRPSIPCHPAIQPATRFQRVERLQPRKKEGRARQQCLPNNDRLPTVSSNFGGFFWVKWKIGRKKCCSGGFLQTFIQGNYTPLPVNIETAYTKQHGHPYRSSFWGILDLSYKGDEC